MRKETFRVKTLPSGLCVIDSTVIPEKEARGWNPHEEHICSDCGHEEGYYHHVGCDMPDCPFCGGQLLSCGCVQERLGFSEDLDCLEEDEEERAEKLLAANGWRPPNPPCDWEKTPLSYEEFKRRAAWCTVQGIPKQEAGW